MTGVPVITLQGGSTPLSAEQNSSKPPYVSVADPLAGQSTTTAARDLLRRLDAILAENSEPIRNTMANLSTFTGALARNSGKLEDIVGGLARLAGGGSANTNQVV